jgi:hypothetical protein
VGGAHPWWITSVGLSNETRVSRKGPLQRGQEVIQANRRRGRRECGVFEAACHCQAEAGSVGTCRWRLGCPGCDGKPAGRTHLLATTMLRQTPRISRSTVRLLADPKPSQKSALPNARSLHQQRTLVHPCRFSRNPVSVASTSASIPRLPTRGVEGLQTRSFASTSKNSARYTRSDDRHRRVVNRPLVGTTDGDLPRKNRRANPFLPFQTSSFVDAFVTTIVGVGISESGKYERWGRTEAEWTLA